MWIKGELKVLQIEQGIQVRGVLSIVKLLFSHNHVLYGNVEAYISANLEFFLHFWIFPEIA